jgi:GNAT superfamily N-acetyltransferase
VADAAGIAHVHTEGWRRGYAGLVPESYLAALDEHGRAARWRDALDDTDVLVAEASGEVAGFAALAVPARDIDDPAVGEITGLYVHPRHWRRGIGRALVDAAAAELRDQGCDVMAVWTYEAGPTGRGFYAALGFAPDGARKIDERTGVPEVRLRARLD